MISKKYRLKEMEVKKVLQWWKPFFSFWIVLNYKMNKIWHNRFAIILSWKNVASWVERNFFRRRFFSFCKSYFIWNYDLVFLLKKQTLFSKKNKESIDSFDNDIKFLLKKSIDIKSSIKEKIKINP